MCFIKVLNEFIKLLILKEQNKTAVKTASISSHHLSFSAFYVILVPLEYIPSIPPHSTYAIVFCTKRSP